jgi:hypothetical protein
MVTNAMQHAWCAVAHAALSRHESGHASGHTVSNVFLLALAVVPEQLASLILPEMAAADGSLLADVAGRPADEAAAPAALSGVQAATKAHNERIDSLFADGGVLHGKVSESRAANAMHHMCK